MLEEQGVAAGWRERKAPRAGGAEAHAALVTEIGLQLGDRLRGRRTVLGVKGEDRTGGN